MLEDQLRRIREWSANPTPESARNLIRLYAESEWRSTRLEVIRALGRFQDSRSLPFLVDLIIKNEDLAEQELAVLSLARQKTRGARLFLRNHYASAGSALKPVLAYGLGLSQDYQSAPFLLKDLEEHREKPNPIFLKNLVLALGELKEVRALPMIHEFLEQKKHDERDLLLAFLFALGRLERNPALISKYESRFLEESILWQVYQASLAQVQIRSQFKLEDYLQKIFESERPHPLLPFELRSFQPDEVEAGLSIFPKDQFFKRHLYCLRAFPEDTDSRMLEALRPADSDWSSFFGAMIEAQAGISDRAVAERLLAAAGGESASLELRLDWIDAFLPSIDFVREAPRFLGLSEERLATRFINLWSERAFSESKSEVRKQLRSFLKTGLKEGAFSRLIRACVELGVEDTSIEEEWETRFKNPKNRMALLMYAEQFAWQPAKTAILGIAYEGQTGLLPRALGYFEAMGASSKLSVSDQKLSDFLRQISGFKEAQAGVLRVLRFVPLPSFEKDVIQAMTNPDGQLQLNAVIAAKAYSKSREIGEVLAGCLGAESEILRGRALDSILSNTTLLAKRAAIRHLEMNIGNDEVVDKVYRDFDPEKKGGEEFFRQVSDLLKSNPDHPHWEKLVSLRDRLKSGHAEPEVPGKPESAEVTVIDQRLIEMIPGFAGLDLTAKLALRAAEQPFIRAEGEANLPIDKAPSVLEFCKALDLVLERHLGQKHLFPKLDRELHDFQTLWHRVGFGEDYPQTDRVMGLLGLKGKIAPEAFPLHKAKQMCGAFFNGKILQDRFKIFDGLRAWAVIFLVFSRKVQIQGVDYGPLIRLPHLSDEKILVMAKRLMTLQDLRNPAAHRQTYPEIESIKLVRSEAIELINWIAGAKIG